MRHPRLATFLLLLVSTALALGVAEVVLRNVVDFAADEPGEYLVPHPILGWHLQPGAHYEAAPDGHLIEIAYNQRGWRDVERTPAPSDDPRIVVLGDSFMEGFTVPLEQSFHRVLQRELRPRMPGLEVINLGVSGYGTLQELLAYRLEGRLYQPDLVLLAFYLHNDPRDNSLEVETLRKPGSEKARNRPFLLPGDGWQVTAVEADRARERYESALARRHSWWWRLGKVSRLWRLTGAEWIDSALRSLEEGAKPEDTLTRAERHALELEIFACEVPPIYQRAWRITLRILARLDEEVRADGARLVVFTVPSEIEASPAPRGLGETELPCREDPPAYAPLRAFVSAHDIPFIDLRPAFQQRMRETGQQLFSQGDAHWNAAGHALAAREVEKGLEKLGLVPIPSEAAPHAR